MYVISKRLSSLVSCLLAATIVASSASAQQPGKVVGCVTIVNPTENSAVGGDGDVVGVVKTPVQGYVWLFARRTGLANWWPQGDGPATIDASGNWKVFTTFGVERDIGHQFEIVAMVVDAQSNTRLLAWFAISDSTGKYPPIALPPAVGECFAKTTVRRTN
jgi:hypothetical protein